MPAFCPGYVSAPFDELAADYPDHTAYPFEDFRVEWGPIFHRGRLDGSARVLLIGQDPGQHENIVRRILVGEAGRRVQGFLGKLGIETSYVMINALLYSVYGAGGGKYVNRPEVRAYRDQWLRALLAPGKIEAVVTFGIMARKAWEGFVEQAQAPIGVGVAHLTHPTFPESAGGTAVERAANTQEMLQQWNAALSALHPAIHHKDRPDVALFPYAGAFADEDKCAIPSFDLPAGTPAWMYADDGWARRAGETLDVKRRNITLTVPEGVLP
jgi:uracil-DNA glycosylase